MQFVWSFIQRSLLLSLLMAQSFIIHFDFHRSDVPDFYMCKKIEQKKRTIDDKIKYRPDSKWIKPFILFGSSSKMGFMVLLLLSIVVVVVGWQFSIWASILDNCSHDDSIYCVCLFPCASFRIRFSRCSKSVVKRHITFHFIRRCLSQWLLFLCDYKIIYSWVTHSYIFILYILLMFYLTSFIGLRLHVVVLIADRCQKQLTEEHRENGKG